MDPTTPKKTAEKTPLVFASPAAPSSPAIHASPAPPTPHPPLIPTPAERKPSPRKRFGATPVGANGGGVYRTKVKPTRQQAPRDPLWRFRNNPYGIPPPSLPNTNPSAGIVHAQENHAHVFNRGDWDFVHEMKRMQLNRTLQATLVLGEYDVDRAAIHGAATVKARRERDERAEQRWEARREVQERIWASEVAQQEHVQLLKADRLARIEKEKHERKKQLEEQARQTELERQRQLEQEARQREFERQAQLEDQEFDLQVHLANREFHQIQWGFGEDAKARHRAEAIRLYRDRYMWKCQAADPSDWAAAEQRAAKDVDEFIRECDAYDAIWENLKSYETSTLPIDLFPFPWFRTAPGSVPTDRIDDEKIGMFLLHHLRRATAGKSARNILRAELLRWHPDKIARIISRVPEEFREYVNTIACKITPAIVRLAQQAAF